MDISDRINNVRVSERLGINIGSMAVVRLRG